MAFCLFLFETVIWKIASIQIAAVDFLSRKNIVKNICREFCGYVFIRHNALVWAHYPGLNLIILRQKM